MSDVAGARADCEVDRAKSTGESPVGQANLEGCDCLSENTVCSFHQNKRKHAGQVVRGKEVRPASLKPSPNGPPSQRRAVTKPAVPRGISSQKSWLASWLEQAIEGLQFQFTGIVLGPSILGRDLCFDTAVMALYQASEVYLRRSSTPSHQDEKILKAALANYGRAVTLLRHKLASSKYVPSESATATSSALATFDLMIADGADDKIGYSASFAHFEACKWFLEAQSQNPSSTPTTIARTFFKDYCRFELFRVCSLGKLNAVTASICENTYWSGMEPFSLAPLPSNYASLQRASHEIDLRLARLTQCVRMLRDGDDISASQVTALADLMLEFENLPAENETLHQVGVVRTTNIAERQIVPVSFDFDSQHWPMLTHYWATLLALVRLRLLIDFLARKEHRLRWLDEEKTATRRLEPAHVPAVRIRSKHSGEVTSRASVGDCLGNACRQIDDPSRSPSGCDEAVDTDTASTLRRELLARLDGA